MANVNPTDALAIGVYHFHPRWTKNYGEEIEKRIEEFEDKLEYIDIAEEKKEKYSQKDIFIFSTRTQAEEFLTKIQNYNF